MLWTDVVRSIFDLYLEEDKTVILRPWDSTATIRSLSSPNDLPNASNDTTWKKYAVGLGIISFGRDIWCSIHCRYNIDHENFQWPGKHKDWFETQSNGAYPQVIHDSDNEIDLGYFVWSGDFIDTEQLRAVIDASYHTPKGYDGKCGSHSCTGSSSSLSPNLKTLSLQKRMTKPNTHAYIQNRIALFC